MSHPAFIYSKSIMETPQQFVKCRLGDSSDMSSFERSWILEKHFFVPVDFIVFSTTVGEEAA